MTHRITRKPGPNSVDDQRLKRRLDTHEEWKEKRRVRFGTKRFETLANSESLNYSPEKIQELANQLVRGENTESCLNELTYIFSIGLVDDFLQIPDAINELIRLLTDLGYDLSVEAAACFANLAAHDAHCASLVRRLAGHYLVIYLSSNCQRLQCQCAWAIGNLVASDNCHRKYMIRQGAVTSLSYMMNSDCEAVIQAAAFALANFTRGGLKYAQCVAQSQVLPRVTELLVKDSVSADVVVEIAWVPAWMSSHSNLDKELTNSGITDVIVQALEKRRYIHAPQILTPLMRCLGNLSSSSLNIQPSETLLKAVHELLNFNLPHVQKEAAWILQNFYKISAMPS